MALEVAQELHRSGSGGLELREEKELVVVRAPLPPSLTSDLVNSARWTDFSFYR